MTRAGKWVSDHLILGIGLLVLLYMFLPIFIVILMSFNDPASKVSYQFVFWLIVVAYQLAAVDSLLDWRFSRSAWDYVGRSKKHAEIGKPDEWMRRHAGE